MGFLGKAMKGGLAMKAMSIAKREASKPENQRKAKSLLGKVTGRGGTPKRSGRR